MAKRKRTIVNVSGIGNSQSQNQGEPPSHNQQEQPLEAENCEEAESIAQEPTPLAASESQPGIHM